MLRRLIAEGSACHLQTARRKAEERNPDEFYHAMQSVRTREGVHQVG